MPRPIKYWLKGCKYFWTYLSLFSLMDITLWNICFHCDLKSLVKKTWVVLTIISLITANKGVDTFYRHCIIFFSRLHYFTYKCIFCSSKSPDWQVFRLSCVSKPPHPPGYLSGLELVCPFHMDKLLRWENHATVRLGILQTKTITHYSLAKYSRKKIALNSGKAKSHNECPNNNPAECIVWEVYFCNFSVEVLFKRGDGIDPGVDVADEVVDEKMKKKNRCKKWQDKCLMWLHVKNCLKIPVCE